MAVTNPNIRDVSAGFNVSRALFDRIMGRCLVLGISRQEWLNRLVVAELERVKSETKASKQ